MNCYVVGFVRDSESNSLLLIKKNRPLRQQGRLNGVGGSIEKNETPLDAMIRECKEEIGIRIDGQYWSQFCILTDEAQKWIIYFFTATILLLKENAKQTTDESLVFLKYPYDLTNTTNNLNWLIPMAFADYPIDCQAIEMR